MMIIEIKPIKTYQLFTTDFRDQYCIKPILIHSQAKQKSLLRMQL